MQANQRQFDEQTYLSRNPDVSRAVGSGQFRSGLDHFLAFGHAENRPGVTFDPILAASTMSQPPEHLRCRVHGAQDLDTYLRVGLAIAEDINRLISDGFATISTDARVLDFGSGPGRVTTWMRQRHPQCELFATDIDAEAIDWARTNLGAVAQFECNASMPPLRYLDDYFDFIYSISVFTHLPEDMQSAWLRELARVMRPGGQLVATTHGSYPLPFVMRSRGFYYKVGRGTDGLPAYYQNSYQTADYVERTWQRYFTVEKIIPRGLARHQDLVICRK
jgi:ubiquinone/menaquinone biosynthesis C-methylase UbiE